MVATLTTYFRNSPRKEFFKRKKMKEKKPKGPWETVVNFIVHGVVATAIFFAIALPAVALDYFVHYLEVTHVAYFTVTVLKGLEGAIVLIDAAAVLWYIGALVHWYIVVSMYRKL